VAESESAKDAEKAATVVKGANAENPDDYSIAEVGGSGYTCYPIEATCNSGDQNISARV